MTRRKFFSKLTAVPWVAAIWWAATRALPKKYLWAKRVEEYPGPIKHVGDITKQIKWSG